MEKELEPEKLAKLKQILETDSVSSPSLPKKNVPKSLELLSSPYLKICLTLVLFLLIFTITFATAYFNIQKQQQTSDQNIVPESEVVLPTSTQEDETASWKTHISNYGFSFKYPEKWVLDDVGENGPEKIISWIRLSPSENTVGYIHIQFTGIEYAEYKEKTEIEPKKIIVDSSEGFKSETTFGDGSNNIMLVLPSSLSSKQSIVIYANTELENTFNQILSTFEFLD